MGRGSKVRVICKRGRKNPKLVQDGSREFITVIEGVSANGVILPPLVINKGKAHYMGWHTYVSENEPAYFAFSAKGWTDNELGSEYHQRLPLCTKPLLIVLKL